MLSIKKFCFNDFSENTFILYDDKNCLIIDPGCYYENEIKECVGFIKSNELSPVSIINTHCHIDHLLGVQYLKDHFDIPFYIGEHELDTYRSVKLYAPAYGIRNYQEVGVDGFFKDGEKITMGKHTWEVLFVPGHSAGHVAFYNKVAGHCIAGDVLFNRSIGRTDLPGGDFSTLINSIRSRLFSLPEQTVIYPGHGPETTINDEKLYNPFCGRNAELS